MEGVLQQSPAEFAIAPPCRRRDARSSGGSLPPARKAPQPAPLSERERHLYPGGHFTALYRRMPNSISAGEQTDKQGEISFERAAEAEGPGSYRRECEFYRSERHSWDSSGP